jgi:hypothetical protein
VGNGTGVDQGIINLIANGIDKSSEYGIRMEFNASVAAFGSIQGDIDVTALESIEINLNYESAHALFGFQRNTISELYSIFPYLSFYPYIPSNHINVPLLSKTSVISSGLQADIVFDTQITEDGIGQFIAYAGTIEQVLISQTNAPSQLSLTAYGDGEVMGDISFRQEGGLSFRGFDAGAFYTLPIPNQVESNIIFLANDLSSDIVIKTTLEATSSDINIITPELTIGSERKLQIRSISRDGDSNVQLDSERRISVTTTGPGYGPGTDLPGIELRAYRSQILIDAGDLGDVVHHALRNEYLDSDSGFEFVSQGTLQFVTGTLSLASSEGGVTFSYVDLTNDAATSITFLTFGNGQYFGDDITISSKVVILQATNTLDIIASGGNIDFNSDLALQSLLPIL